MMGEYEFDYSKYKEVELYDLRVDFSSESFVDVVGVLETMVKKAEKRGLKNIRLQFESTYEPYEDYLGTPTVMPVGLVPMIEEDIQDGLNNAKAESLAKELGTYVAAAHEILRLKEEGKL